MPSAFDRLRRAQRVLLIGGARSGKSATAERLLLNAPDTVYVATSATSSEDPDWQERVALHRARRPVSWTTRETADIASLIAEPGPPLLIDCLTLWLTRTIDRHDAWESALTPVDTEIAAVVVALAQSNRRIVLVTNEVGQGVVPVTSAGRRFRDQMGLMNSRVAEAVDEVAWVIAGRVLLLDAGGGSQDG